ncbi:MAG: NfeD family protein [Clostridium sp.]|nr:NfeD family protein [Clostridium sp.]
MQPTIFWLIALVIFAAIEGFTVGLTGIWFAAGSLAALAAAGLGARPLIQVAVCLTVAALSMLLLRPIAKKHLKPRYTPTNADRILGKTALVTEDIDASSGAGLVNISGQVWSARSEDGSLIPAGTEVTILRIEGVKVYVVPVK